MRLPAVLADDNVGAVVALQDTQESLNPATLQNYMSILNVYAQSGRDAQKPFVVISPTSENVDPGVRALLAENGVPLLRGLTPGLQAVGHLSAGKPELAAAWGEARKPGRKPFHPNAEAFRRELSGRPGPLDASNAFRILREYGLPVVKSIVVSDLEEAVQKAGDVGFPMVVKVSSRQIQHRSDVGGVILDVADEAALRRAITTIRENVSAANPTAVIDGYELQEQVIDGVEALAGFTSAQPFGQLIVLGSGGTLVEIMADRATKLAPLDRSNAVEMLGRTKLAKVLDGYRNLMPKTDTTHLVELAVNLSKLASDLDGVMVACDLNPVVVRKGTGEVRIVDALCITA